MSRKYKFHKPEAAYFISFATVNWVDVFTRENYFQIIIDSLNYCRKNKGMELYCYCIMPNHIHLIFRSIKEDPSGLIRDFKGYTSRKIISTIKENPKESKEEYLLKMFEDVGKTKSNIERYQLWQHDNMPIELFSDRVINQKVNYIHRNPVKAGLVFNSIDWKYSSAKNYSGDQSVLEIDLMGARIDRTEV